MIVDQIFLIFAAFSLAGWVYECTYCTFKTGHWQNRGFLYGPVCPIYGSGVAIAYLIFCILPTYLPSMNSLMDSPWWVVFLVSALGSAVLEFGTSWVLERFFHAVWWDYSDIPFNIQGRICLPATCAFGVAGVLLTKFVFPWLNDVVAASNPLLAELLTIVAVFVLSADFALTVASLTSILTKMEESQKSFDNRAEQGVALVQQGPAAVATAVADAASAGVSKLADAAAERLEAPTEEEMNERFNSFISQLSKRDRYHFGSIERFTESDSKAVYKRLQDRFRALQDKLGKPEDRQVEKRG